jgi:hypothetical protein
MVREQLLIDISSDWQLKLGDERFGREKIHYFRH